MHDSSTRAAIASTRPRDVSGAVPATRADTTQGQADTPTEAAGACFGLRWPPTADDLDAVEVVVLGVEPTLGPPGRPALVPTTLSRNQARGIPLRVAATALPDIVDLEDADEDAFAREDESSRRLNSPSAASRVRRYVRASAAAATMAAAASLLVSADHVDVSTVRSLVAMWQPSNVATSQTGVAPTVSSDGTDMSLMSSAETPAHAPERSDVADSRATERAPATAPPAGVIARTDATTLVRMPDTAVRSTAAELPVVDRTTRLVETTPATDTPPDAASVVMARPPSNAAETPRGDLAPAPPSPQTVASSLTGAAVIPEVRAPLAPPPAPAAASASTSPVVRPAAPTVSDDVRIQGVLRRYEAAYGQLDAKAAQAVWPGVDVRALSRAFEGLESQSVRLGSCEFDVRGNEANADCLGSTTYVPRIGSRAPRTELRSWTFRLQKAGENWQIVAAEIR